MTKKPKGNEFETWCFEWDIADHAGKVTLCQVYDVSYETGRHWRSDASIPTKPRAIPTPYSGYSMTVTMGRPNTPLQLRTTKDISTMAIIGDTHNPYQDDRTMAVVEEFLAELQPDYLVYNGDINDFYQVSVFAKDPARLGSLQEDLTITHNMFARHRAIMPNTKMWLDEGTHENRWIKYLQQKAPALAALYGTTIGELYKLPQFDIDLVPFEQGILINGVFLVLHGDIVSKHSSMTAKSHFEKQGGSGMCNHSHRGGSYYKRDRFGTYGWFENFCLCTLEPDWLTNPDWVQGFSLVHFDRSNKFWVEQIPIIHSTFIYGGRVYGR